MSSDLAYCSFEEAQKVIKSDYIDKVLDFMSGKSARVVSTKQYMDVYQIVMHQCDQQDNGAQLFTLFESAIKDYIKNNALPYTRSVSRDDFLKAFVKIWNDYNMYAKLLDKMFDYLNRYYLKNQSMKSLGQTALQKFNELYYDVIKSELRDAVLNALSKDRNNNIIDREVVKRTIKCYVDMGLNGAKPMKSTEGFRWEGDQNLATYEQEFEQHMLTHARQEYEMKSNVWNAQLNCPEYLREVDNALTKEEENADYWLQPETKSKILKRIEKEMISNKSESVVEKDTGCDYMFLHSRLEELALMYKIFKRDANTLTLIIHKMIPYIEGRGEKIVKNEQNLKDPIEFTRQLLELKKEMDKLIEESFQNDMKFQKGRDTSFQNFMNSQNQTPSYIAQYTDRELKVGLKGVNNEETEVRLDSIVRLFCCLHGRDVFIKAYTKLLSTRLLNKTFLSHEAEETMLQKLKVECGLNTVNKMSQMFTDIQLSKDLQKEFEVKRGNAIGGVIFSAEVLTSGNWPVDSNLTCNIPAPMKTCSEAFNLFYKNKHQNRNLTWLFQVGSVELKPLFTPKQYQLVVNVFQASVCMLFNSNAVLTFGDIKQMTNIPEENLLAALRHLCNPKIKLLKKEINKPVFEAGEKITVNEKFANASLRLTIIPQQTAKRKTAEPTDEDKEIDKGVKAERQAVCDANIVKIMKTHKQVTHQELVQKVIAAISMFQAQPPMIKQRIESLIERSYMKRDDKNKALYIYLP